MRPTRAMATSGILDDLQDALNHGSVSRRVALLRRVTDLFLHGAHEYSDSQIALFDDVFQCLVRHMHDEARTTLSTRLAMVGTAPRGIIRTLALDDLIEVAAPVLAQSDLLDEQTLIETATAKSQAHLLAIAGRKSLSAALTEVLVHRGDDEVVSTTASNHAASFSPRGYEKLIERASAHHGIAECVALRPNLPRYHVVRLMAKASVSVQTRLRELFPDDQTSVVSAVENAAATLAFALPVSRETASAYALVRSLAADKRLSDAQVGRFALDNKFDEVSASLATLARLPIPITETLLAEAQSEGIFILAKVCGLSWATVEAISQMRSMLAGSDRGVTTPGDRDAFEHLRDTTAHQVLRFHRSQIGPLSSPSLSPCVDEF